MSEEKFKTGITAKELSGLRRQRTPRMVIDCAQMMAEQVQFNVGDVLVAINRQDGKPCMQQGDMPQKFIVVHKDEANLIYCKKVLMSGKIGQGLDLICTWNSRYRFQIDPELAEHIILDAEDQYDPLVQAREYRKLRDRVKRFNDKFKVKLSYGNLTEVGAFFDTLAVGGTIWTATSSDGNGIVKWTISDIVEKPLDMTVKKATYSYNNVAPDDELSKLGWKTKKEIEVKSSAGKKEVWTVRDCWWKTFYTQQPKSANSGEV